jgi:hypothetical protein
MPKIASRPDPHKHNLLRRWRAWHAEKLEETLQGPHGAELRRLLGSLDALTIEDGELLIRHVRGAGFNRAGRDLRYLVLQVIDQSISRLREQHGLAPFDDALEGEPLTAFQVIREILSPDAGNAAPPLVSPRGPKKADHHG